MGFLKRILGLLNEKQDNVPTNTITKFREWCDEKNLYMDNSKVIKQFSSEQQNPEEVEKYLLDVLTVRS